MAGRKKISIIGAGQIGALVSYFASQKELGDVVLFDIVEGMPIGKALDQKQAAAIQNIDSSYVGTNDYKDIEGSDVVVVIAGLPRKPGMSRDDLININGEIIKQVGENIRKHAPNSFLVCVTNPLDIMVHVLHRHSGVPPHMIVGMAGILDTARYKSFIAEKLNVSVKDVSAIVLGAHGDSMVPLRYATSVGGIPIIELIKAKIISEEDITSMIDRTRHGGAEVLGHLKQGSAYHAPAAAVIEIIESFLKDQKRLLPCASYLSGQYGISGYFIGVPIVIGSEGVERIIELKLENEEKRLFDESASHIMKLQDSFQLPM